MKSINLHKIYRATFKPYLIVLGKRDFFPLCFGQIVSQFGDKLTQLALVSLIGSFFLASESASATALATIISMSVIPVVIFSPLTGVYVDRWNKRKTMYYCDLTRGILVALIPLFFLQIKFFPIICLIIFLSSSVGRFFIPAKMAFLPHIIKEENFFIANSLISVTATSAAILGVGFGGYLVDKFGLSYVFYVDAYTFLISALAISFIVAKEKEKFIAKDILNIGKDAFIKVKRSFFYELKEGVHYIFASDETKYACRTFFFLLSYAGALSTVFIRYIQDVLSVPSQNVKDIAFTTLTFAIGIFIGSLSYGRIAHKFSIKKTINLAIFLASAFLLFFVVSLHFYPSRIYALSLSLILGLIVSPVFIGVSSLIHSESQRELLGRIFSSLEFVSHLGFLISMFVCAVLADIFTPFTIIISIGIIGFFVSAFFMLKK